MMRPLKIWLMGLTAVLLATTNDAAAAEVKAIPIAKIKHAGPVNFEKEVLPILKNNCLACHNQTKPKGGLVLETPETILKGGDAGPAVVPRKPRESLLLKAATHEDPELIMPPAENKVAAMPLTSDELGLIQLWIEQGAKGEVRASAPITWQPIPSALQAIYAVALTRDGQFAACGRGNQLFIYHVPAGRLVARLDDPSLAKASLRGAAHRDTINSLAFSPDGEVLASGGYREVKLWRRAQRTDRVPNAAEFAAMIQNGKLLAAAITNGQLQVRDTNGTLLQTNLFSTTMEELKGDFRARFVLGERERAVTFAKTEIEFHQAALKAAETNQVAALARQKKAADTNAALEKIALTKATALTNALAARSEAESGISALGPQVSALVEAFFSAEKEFTNTTAMAKAVKDGADKKKVEQLVEASLAKSNALADAKAALDNLPAETKSAQKLATEKLLASKKAVIDAEKELAKAEQVRKTAAHELELAEAAVRKMDEALARTKSELAGSESEAKSAEAALNTAQQALTKSESPVRLLAYSKEERTLVTLGEAGNVRFWSAETGAPIDPTWKSPWRLERVIGSGDANSPIADRVNALRFTPDGRQLFSGGGEPTRGGEIKLWRVKDGAPVRDFPNVHSDSVLALELSPDGKYLASGAADRFARIIELESGKVVRAFEGHTHHVLGISWKRDGRTLITAGADNVAKAWNAKTGERRKNIEGFGKGVTSASFMGVSDEALLSAGDGQVVLVKGNGDKVRSFAGATDYVYATAATPDGDTIAAGGVDGVLRVWQGKTGKLIAEFGRAN